MPQPPARPALGLGVKLSYGVGSVASGVAGQALSTSIITLYLNQVIGMPAALVGAAIMISLFIDALIDPFVGRWSDNTRSRWGRRHPFMYASAIPCALAFYFLWHPPSGWAPEKLFVFTLLMMVLVRLLLATFEIPSAALTPELAPDYHERTTLVSFRSFFGLLGAATMYVLLFGVFLRKDASHPLGILNKAGYETWGAIAAVVMLVSILASSIATHHLIRYLEQPKARRIGVSLALRELLTTLSNPSLVVLMVSGLVGGIAGGISATLGNYFSLHFWGLAPQTLAGLLIFLLPAAILATVITPAISRRVGKKQTMVAILSISLVTSLIPISLRLIGWMPPNGSLLLLVILAIDLTISAGLTVGGLVIIASMIADVVEDNAVKTGVRSEGLLFAANGLLPKFTTGIGGLIGALLLEAAHFPVHAQQGSVAPGVLRHLALLYLPVMAMMNALSIVILSFYRIDRTTHERNLAKLAEAAAHPQTEDAEAASEREAALMSRIT